MDDIAQEFNDLYHIMKMCYQCGACAGRCPIFRHYSHFNPRKIMKKLLSGEFNKKTLDEQQIWYCRMCSVCSTRCPQGIDVGYVIKELKKISLKISNSHTGNTSLKKPQKALVTD